MIDRDAVWFITGCSRGLGRALAEQALSAGYRVAATARRLDDVADLQETGRSRRGPAATQRRISLQTSV